MAYSNDEARDKNGEWTSGGAMGHQKDTDAIGRVHNTLAGRIVLGIKDPATMTNGELQKEYERTTLHASAVGRQFINAGRGMERPNEMNPTDPLVQTYRAINGRASALNDEAGYRNRMGGRRVQTEDGRVRFVGKQPGTLRSGYFEGSK